MTATRSILLDLAELLGQLRTNAAGLTGIRQGRIGGKGHGDGIHATIVDPWITEVIATDEGDKVIEYGTVSNIVSVAVRILLEDIDTWMPERTHDWDTRSWVLWLATRADQLDHHPAGLDLIGELTRARDVVARIVDPQRGESDHQRQRWQDAAPLGAELALQGAPLDAWLPIATAAQLATHLGHPVSQRTAYRWSEEPGADLRYLPHLCVRTQWLIERQQTAKRCQDLAQQTSEGTAA